MALTPEEIATLKIELDTDPISIGWSVMNNEDVVTRINKRVMIANPTSQATIKKVISVTKFINIIPEAEWLKMYNDVGVNKYGRLIYDRLLSLESAGAVILTTEALITRLMNYCKSQTLISQDTYDTLEASDNTLDPDWQNEILDDARATIIGIGTVEGNDVKAARTV